MKKGILHAIAGQIGSGKTTYARFLAQEKKAMFFSTDQWLEGLGVPMAVMRFENLTIIEGGNKEVSK